MHILLTYDIISDRRRTRLAKALCGYLNRVQKSVFEGEIPDTRLEKLYSAIERHINPNEDSVRVYRLCQRCVVAVDIMGTGEFIEKDQDEIV